MPEVCRECNNVECSHLDQVLARDFFLLRERLRYRTPGWQDAERMLYENAKFGEVHVAIQSNLNGKFEVKSLGGKPSVVELPDGTKSVKL